MTKHIRLYFHNEEGRLEFVDIVVPREQYRKEKWHFAFALETD